MYILHISALPYIRKTCIYVTYIFSTTPWHNKMKADHLRNFNSIVLPNCEKYKKANRTLLIHFLSSPELWMYHTPLIWYE